MKAVRYAIRCRKYEILVWLLTLLTDRETSLVPFLVEDQTLPLWLDHRTSWEVASDLQRMLPGHIRLSDNLDAWRTTVVAALDDHLLPDIRNLATAYL